MGSASFNLALYSAQKSQQDYNIMSIKRYLQSIITTTITYCLNNEGHKKLRTQTHAWLYFTIWHASVEIKGPQNKTNPYIKI
jgi:hypothetical protein